MNIPKKIYAGTTIKWRDDAAAGPLDESITSADWTLKYFLRTNGRPQGHTVTGTSYGTGWEFTISATDSAGFEAGDWFFFVEASKDSEKFTLGSGQLEILLSLAYTGDPGKFDGRTAAQKELDDIEAALAKFRDGAQEYSIGNRTFKRVAMADLQLRRDRLKAIVVRERKAAMIANGLGDPHSLYVRF